MEGAVISAVSLDNAVKEAFDVDEETDKKG